MSGKSNNFTAKGGRGALTDFCRTTSCFGDPAASALACLNNRDENQFRSVLADVCPLEDQNVEGDPGVFPLPEDHWINLPYGEVEGLKTLLHLAIEQADVSYIKALISAGARADGHNEHLGKSPIHVAVEQGSLRSVQILLEHMDKKPRMNKAKLSAFNRLGQTALHLAAASGRNDILSYLLEHPDLKDVDPRDLTGGQTPLYLAVKNGHAKSAETLIAHGAQLSFA
eukprot:maker-scaffold205_size259573-snap-gene-1.35 protein:Tk01386 transcript:maker-scaffold205_size259573-snap-gene-1.35-mRNA-1 annotation:"ankyrin"